MRYIVFHLELLNLIFIHNYLFLFKSLVCENWGFYFYPSKITGKPYICIRIVIHNNFTSNPWFVKIGDFFFLSPKIDVYRDLN